MWIRFTRNFDWEPPELKGRAVTAYKAGMERFVRRNCAEAALAAGAAVRTGRPGPDDEVKTGPEIVFPEDVEPTEALRAEYEELTGKAPDGRWGLHTLTCKVAEARDGETD